MKDQDKFFLYWLNTRTGEGSPTLQWPEPMSFAEAKALVDAHGRNRFGFQLRYEPFEVHMKFTHHKPRV